MRLRSALPFLILALIGKSCGEPLPDKATVERLLGDFQLVEGGSYMMGDTLLDSTGHITHVPHAVVVDGFYFQSKEVTQKLYTVVMGENPSTDSTWEDLPVAGVSWFDCQSFIEKINGITGKTYRLPTEAEWEFAAKGGRLGSGFVFSGSNDADSVAWHRANSKGRIQPVGKLHPNEIGIYDMSGNVWEWCSDFYSDYRTDSSKMNNPVGPDKGHMRVFRGGSYNDSSRFSKSTSRYYTDPKLNYPLIGFRLVRADSKPNR
jgi:formylglycine-generating enzyme required for sulfatase activity